MTDIYCPSCGKEHTSNERYCAFCGADLEPIILKFKEKHLPLSFNNGKKQKIPDDPKTPDEWELRRQEVLRIKQANEEEKIKSTYRTIPSYPTSGRVHTVGKDSEDLQERLKRIPKKSTRNALSILIILLIIAIIALGVVYYYNDDFFGGELEGFGNFIIIEIGLSILLIIFIIPFTIISSRIKTGGRKSCYYSESRRNKDYYAEECAAEAFFAALCCGLSGCRD